MALLITVLLVPGVVFRVAGALEAGPMLLVGLLLLGALAAASLYTALADGLTSFCTLLRPRR